MQVVCEVFAPKISIIFNFQCDIDEILQRAETRDEAPTMVGDELLSAFKVASFAFDEEKAVMEVKKENIEEESKDWVNI